VPFFYTKINLFCSIDLSVDFAALPRRNAARLASPAFPPKNKGGYASEMTTANSLS